MEEQPESTQTAGNTVKDPPGTPASENTAKTGNKTENLSVKTSAPSGPAPVEKAPEKPDEDVPEDFFDDFLKEDFMAGLDIVDEDDEELEKSQTDKNRKFKEADEQPQRGKIDHVKKFRDSPPGPKSVKMNRKKKKAVKAKAHELELKQLDKELEQIRKAPLKRPQKSGLDVDSFDIRRDPEKTKRAIQRDKIKSAKDKEKRLITDIVETGLVPPGMELEVDIGGENNIITDLRQKIRPKKSRSKSLENLKSVVKKVTPPRRRSRSPVKRHRTKSPVPKISPSSAELHSKRVRHRSPKRSPLVTRQSPIYRKSPPVTRRSSPPMRSPRRSPLMRSPRRSPPPRRRTRSPLYRRKSRSRSPLRRRSPLYRSRSRERRRRERSISPLRRRRSRSRSPNKKIKKEEKLSFLEELVAKLNETHPPPGMSVPIQPPIVHHMAPTVSYPLPTVAPIVAPVQPPLPPVQPTYFTPVVPPPQPAPPPAPPAQKYDPYDESFFIGNPPPMRPSQPSPLSSAPARASVQSNGVPYGVNASSDVKDMDKLFGDKRIKLSDFLAITAKPQVHSASTAALQEKIKVIQRCQEAVKILNEKSFTGPLVVHKTRSYAPSKDMTKSPLLRKPVVQLPFTSPGLKVNRDMDFTKCCQTLLYRVGINKDLISQQNQPQETKAKVSLPPKESPSLHKPQKFFDIPVKAVVKSLSTQTDKELSSCKECLKRKGILYANCAIQAGDPMLTFSVSTQVTEADFYSMIPRNQSLASLTPAQLLGKQSMLNEAKSATSFNRTRKIPSPPPPPSFIGGFPGASAASSFQGDGTFLPPMFNQALLPSLLQGRNLPSVTPRYAFDVDDRRGGSGFGNKRF